MTPYKKPKTVKIILLTVTLCCSLLVYYFFFAERIQIEVYNKTNFDIDSLEIDNDFYNIPKQKSLVINCRRLTMQDGLPHRIPNGKIKSMRKAKEFPRFCGTGVEEIDSGKYKFDLQILTGDGTYLLFWKEHSEQ